MRTAQDDDGDRDVAGAKEITNYELTVKLDSEADIDALTEALDGLRAILSEEEDED